MTRTAARPLVVVHYHWRPGGVRRVIETALPALARTGRFDRVILVSGAAPDDAWLAARREELDPWPVEVAVNPAFGYRSVRDGSARPGADVEEAGARLLAGAGEDAVVWLHNPALGRHALLAGSLARAAAERGAVLLCHHHDFFFDNRWGHWPGLVADGLRDLRAMAEAFFPAGPRAVHLCLNAADHALMEGGFGPRAIKLRNPVARPPLRREDGEAARRWLEARCGAADRCWLAPCRLLRRKNLAEAVLLARWLVPGTAVVTTGGPSSPDEQAYAGRLAAAARRDAWPFYPSVLEGDTRAPSVAALMTAAGAVVSTSLREGFGLTVYEAAALHRPVLARATADLASSGPADAILYEDVMVPRDLFDWRSEKARCEALWLQWRSLLPPEAAAFAGAPVLPCEDSGEAWTFSRLTWRAQLEVLGRSPADLAPALDGLNPRLAQRREAGFPPACRAETGAGFTDAERFAAEFLAAIGRADMAEPPDPAASVRVLEGFLRERLAGANFYPLLAGTEI